MAPLRASAVLVCVLVALLAAAATCSATGTLHRRPDAQSTIEWRAASGEAGEVTMHIVTSGRSSPKSQLFSFDASTSVGELLQSRMVKHLAADRMHSGDVHRCAVRSTARMSHSALDDNERLLDALMRQGAALELSCISQSGVRAAWRFVQFVAQHFAPNEVRKANEARLAATGDLRPYPKDSGELLAESWEGVQGWIDGFLNTHWGPLHPFNDYTTSTTQTGRFHLNTGAVLSEGATFGAESDSPVRIAIAADWGAGTLEADCVQNVMMNGNGTAFNPHWTLHIGDIYYVGAADEVQANCLGVAPEGVAKGVTWPHGSLGSFAVQGNHEMYSRGYGFFDTFLPTLGAADATGKLQGQEAGFVALENAYWRVIMLDTGYNTYSIEAKLDSTNNTQPEAVITWLRDVMHIGNESDTRGLIFLTHHQLESAFGGASPATPLQISALLPANRTVLWLWGHEHRVAWYNLLSLENAVKPMNVYGRCVGNSGFPSNTGPLPSEPARGQLKAYDDRQYIMDTGFFNISISYNGFTRLVLDGPSASLVYSTLATDPATGTLSSTLQTDLVSEQFDVDKDGSVQLVTFDVLNDELTVVQ